MYSAANRKSRFTPNFLDSSLRKSAACEIVAGLLGCVSAMICGVQMISSKPSSAMPLNRTMEVSISGEPSSIPGNRWL